MTESQVVATIGMAPQYFITRGLYRIISNTHGTVVVKAVEHEYDFIRTDYQYYEATQPRLAVIFGKLRFPPPCGRISECFYMTGKGKFRVNAER